MRLVRGPTVSGRTAPSSFGVKASGPQVCPCAYRDSPPAPESRQAEQKETLVLGEQQWEVGTSGGGDGSLPLRLHPYPTQPSTPLTEPLGRLPNTPLRLALASGIIPVSPHTASVNLPQCLCLPCAPHWISRFPFPLPAPQSSMPPPLSFSPLCFIYPFYSNLSLHSELRHFSTQFNSHNEIGKKTEA